MTCSSPRVWGRHPENQLRTIPCRFIPTRVGQTEAEPFGYLGAARFIPTRVGQTPV